MSHGAIPPSGAPGFPSGGVVAPDLKTLIKTVYHTVPQIVAFIDILGFRDLILRLDGERELTQEAYEAVDLLGDLQQVIVRREAPTGMNDPDYFVLAAGVAVAAVSAARLYQPSVKLKDVS